MNPFDRGLMVVYALGGMLAALAAGASLAGWTYVRAALEALSGMPGFYETTYALLIVCFLAGIRLFWQGLHPEKKHAVVQEGSLGKVRIALAAVESLVEKVTLDQKGIKEARATVVSVPRGIGIRIRAAVTPDVNIPLISAALQSNVREKVLEVAGIDVHDIHISVDSIAAQKMRVE